MQFAAFPSDEPPTLARRRGFMRSLRAWRLSCAALALASSLAPSVGGAAPVALAAPPGALAEVFFSPGSHADQALASAIAGATSRVWLAGYYFSSAPIAKALRDAQARKLDVRVVLDRSQATQKYSGAMFLFNQGVPLWIDSRYPIMHHKFLVIDADTIGFGSMNFTRAGAEKNAENFNLFRRWPQLAQVYAREFARLERESQVYRPGMLVEPAPADFGVIE